MSQEREAVASTGANAHELDPVAPGPEPVKSADRVLRLFDLLGNAGPKSAGQIARELELPLSSTHKLLRTVMRRNYVEYEPDSRTYRLGWRFWQLSRAFDHVDDLVDRARPLMQRIVDGVGESVNLARLEDADCVYIGFVESPYGARGVLGVGERFPANATAVGKVLLAALDDADVRRRLSKVRLRRYTERTIGDAEELIAALASVRERGYATSEEELLPGLYSLAMPIRDASQQVVAAMSVSVPAARWNEQTVPRIFRELQRAVYDLSRQMGSKEDLDGLTLKAVGPAVASAGTTPAGGGRGASE